ncbi:hypothetical protein ACEZCY_16655 [Streptacidiphilus sp. N1-12]|uniref:Uncharacterized protein n=2 Tax=Streptacidiphilus alkalitolerans TaxID=3342712 RepID=A0ABV6WFS1_9ACTN
MSTPGQTTTTVLGNDPRKLLTDAQFAAVATTVRSNNPGMEHRTAERITADALCFLAACAHDRTARIAPSPVVDEGWHALILHTAVYAELGERLGGFIHHYPELPEDGGYDPVVITRTLEALGRAGYVPDPELWTGPDQQTITVGALTWHTPPGGCGPIIPIPKPPGGGDESAGLESGCQS